MTDGKQTNYFVHPLLRARDWQHRPQLDEVKEWWRGGGRGVCALVGMGGAGKSAIAERFLRELPGGLPEDPDIPKDTLLPKPNSTFIFSFYDAPNPEAFFRALQFWLDHTPRGEKPLSVGQLLYLLQQTRGLMVLDGLEKVQEDGSRGVFGRLQSPKLREFLDQLAAGYVAQLSILVTSRFYLADLRDARPQFFRSIPIEEIDQQTGIQLLRDRGVHGNDLKLASIVEECGRHALTVDLAGGYIKEYGNGDPSTPLGLGTAEELKKAAEQEQDEDRRAVLKQGYRFARVAERYREAMLKTDEAAISLLERICLFRLGVDSETLAGIFTGPDAVKVSGKALADLDADQLHKKLDWLVRLRIVEATEVKKTGATGRLPASAELTGAPITGRSERILGHSEPSSELTTDNSKLRTLYSIHPAVRDGFISGISREAAEAGHEAVRNGLEDFLGDAPGDNPSDPATLDLLEEIIHHTLQSNHVPEAWDIYWNRVGNWENLGQRLGDCERGERMCRAFACNKPPEYVGRSELGDDESSLVRHADTESETAAIHLGLPFKQLSENAFAAFMNEWAGYLSDLGCLHAAASCYKRAIDLATDQEIWSNVSVGYQNLGNVRSLLGHLKGSGGVLSAVAESLQLAERAENTEQRQNSHADRGFAFALLGDIPAALGNFRASLDLQHEVDGDDGPLYSGRGLNYTNLLARLGRFELAVKLTEANIELWARTSKRDLPRCNLMLSDSPGESIDASSRESMCRAARKWAERRDAKEVLCWAGLVQARIELRKLSAVSHQPLAQEDARENILAAAGTAIRDALKIARDCGFGLYHIDLLLERARLHLLCGNPQAALDDINMALDKGIAANEETGQPELLAANHEECGYAWAIPFGLQLRGEALLLQAAQQVPSVGWAQPTNVALPPVDVVALSNAHPAIGNLIEDAKHCLNEALAKWQPLHDPEPDREDQNFKHPDTGEEHNFRAAETWQILQDLGGGILTGYPLRISLETPRTEQEKRMDRQKPKVFVSHSSRDKPTVRRIVDELQKHSLDVWFDEQVLGVGDSIVSGIDKGLAEADYLLVVLSQNSVRSNWVKNELNYGLMEQASKQAIVVLPAVLDDCEIPPLLKDRKYADFRRSFKDGVQSLLKVFTLESQTASDVGKLELSRGTSNCQAELSGLKLSDLRKRITKRVSREDVGKTWFDVFESKMDDDLKHYTLGECVIELLDRANKRALMDDVIDSLCDERPDLANP